MVADWPQTAARLIDQKPFPLGVPHAMPDHAESRWHGYRSWLDWLRAQMALMPLLALCGAAALTMADARYMVRAEDGEETQRAVTEIHRSLVDVQRTQALNGQRIEAIDKNLDELAEGQDKIDEKLDRLIERQLPR